MREIILSICTGGGGAAIVLALLSWARNKDADKATVAQKWESGVSTLIDSAEARVKQLDTDLATMSSRAAGLRAELIDCQRRCWLLSAELDRTITALEAHGVDVTPYRKRLELIA